MKTCPRCNSKIKEDQTKCPVCNLVFAQWATSHAPTSTWANTWVNGPDPKESKPKKSISESSLKWGVMVYVGLSALVVLISTLPALSMLAFFLLLILVVMLLSDIFKSSVSPGWRKAYPWLITRAVLVGLCVWLVILTNSAIVDEGQREDARIVGSLSQLKPGMHRTVVNEIVHAAKAKFKLNDIAPSKKDPEHREIFFWPRYTPDMFAWFRYDLFIEYGQDGDLIFARYLKSHHSDGQDTSCTIMLEVPAVEGKQYPYPCPPDVQDF